MATSFNAIASLFAELRLDATNFRAGLSDAQATLQTFANLATKQGLALETLKVQIGKVMQVSRQQVNAEIAGLVETTKFRINKNAAIKQGFTQEQAAFAVLNRERLKAVETEKLVTGITRDLSAQLTVALQAEGAKRLASEKATALSILAERKKAALVFKATEENKARDAKIAADKRIATEKFAADITRQLSRQMTASLEADTARRLAAAKVATAQRVENEKIAIAAAMQARKLAATQAIALDQNRTRIAVANRRTETLAAVESATIQRQVARGLVLSSFLVAGRAGLVTGLVGVAGAATVATAAVVLGLGAVIKVSADFNKALIQSTSNIKGMSDALRGSLGAAATALSNQFPVSATKIIESLEQTRQAGLSAQETMKAWPIFVAFNVAANADLGESIKLLVAIQKGFRTEFDLRTQEDRIKNFKFLADTIATAAREGGQAPLELAQALAAAGAAADKTGNSFSEVVAALTIMGLKNIDASRSGEILSQLMQRLRDEAVQNKEEWNRLVPSLKTVGGTAKGLSVVMTELAKVIGTDNDAVNAANSSLLGLEARTSKFLAILLKEGSTIREKTAAMSSLIDIFDLAAERTDNLSDRITVLGQRIANAARVEFGSFLIEQINNLLSFIDVTQAGLDAIQEEQFRKLDKANRVLERFNRLRAEALTAKPGEIGSFESDAILRQAEREVSDLDRRKALIEGLRRKQATQKEVAAGLDPTLGGKKFAEDESIRSAADAARIRKLLGISRIGKLEQHKADLLRIEELFVAESLTQAELFKARVVLATKITALEKSIAAPAKAIADAKQRDLNARNKAIHDALQFEERARLDLLAAEKKDLDARNRAIHTAHQARLKADLAEIESDKKVKALLLLKQEDLEQKVAILRDQALDGQFNKFTLVMARIQAQAAKQNERLRILYGEDLENFENLQEAKVLIFEIAGQRQRQIINRLGAEIESLFDRNILAAESFSDAMANIFNEIANHFKSMVFQMLAAWITGQNDLINSTQKSGGFGGIVGILTSVLGGFIGGGTTSAGLRPPVPFIRAPIGNTLNLDSGGSFRGGQPFLSGVPELIIPSVSGNAVPLDKLGGTINNFIDARGADVAVVSRITRAIERMQKNSSKDAVITTREMALRGFRV